MTTKPLSRSSLIKNLSTGSFQEKINAARDLIRQAKVIDPKFTGQEARSVKGDFVFIGGGRQPGLKNVLVIRRNGSVVRMEPDPTKIKPVLGGGTKIFDVDLSGAEVLVP